MASTPFLLSHTYRPADPRWPILFRAWTPALLLTSLIALESTRIFGSDHTSAPLHAIAHRLAGAAADSHWLTLHHYSRKAGHFLGFVFLSYAFFRGFRLTLRPTTLRHYPHAPALLAVAAAFLAASADELHQHFLPNRTGRISDVVLDTAAAMTLQAALFAIARFSRSSNPR
jgi:VanZ family protein